MDLDRREGVLIAGITFSIGAIPPPRRTERGLIRAEAGATLASVPLTRSREARKGRA